MNITKYLTRILDLLLILQKSLKMHKRKKKRNKYSGNQNYSDARTKDITRKIIDNIFYRPKSPHKILVYQAQ